MMTILYIIMYFLIGLGFAKFKKAYDEIELEVVQSDKYYANFGILWILYTLIWIYAFIHEVYKKYL